MITITTLTPDAVETLGQLFASGPTWDGNICSKSGRSQLVRMNLADRENGFTFLTREGIRLAIEWRGPEIHQNPNWVRKINGR